MGALSHLKVLDLSRVLAGPWASQLLADLGAEVTKIEKPGSGDDTRAWGPPWLADGEGSATRESAYYLCTNRNKRSVTLDITRPEGQAIVRELAADADVLIENFKVGGLAAYGLDYASRDGYRAGEGQHIDLALLDVQVACLANQALNYLVAGTAPRRMGNGHPNIVPYQDFPTADGHMILAIGNDAQFARFCAIAGHAEWSADARFASNAARVRHRDELLPLIRAATAARTTAEWIALLEPAAVPCGPINDLAGVFADPQVIHRGLRVDLPHAAGGTAPQVANPIRLSATPVDYRHAPPLLGQDTDETLRRLGRDAAEIARLRAAGIV